EVLSTPFRGVVEVPLAPVVRDSRERENGWRRRGSHDGSDDGLEIPLLEVLERLVHQHTREGPMAGNPAAVELEHRRTVIRRSPLGVDALRDLDERLGEVDPDDPSAAL